MGWSPVPGRITHSAGSRVSVAVAEYISFTKSQLLDSKVWIGDSQHRLLLFLRDLEEVRPRDLVPHFCSSPKSAYVYVRRLEKLGVLRRVARGVYRVVREVVEELLKLPVRRIGAVRNRNGTRVAPRALASCGLASAARGDPLPTAYGRPGYRGLYLDNLRWYGLDGAYRQLHRSRLVALRHLDPGWGVSYAEVCHLVSGAVLDGVVVVYTNAEDLGRVGPSARVEYRPPSGYVRGNGVASLLLLAREELVKAFKALALALAESLSRSRLLELLVWLVRVWDLSPVCV